MPSLAQLIEAQDEVFAAMRTLAASPEGTVSVAGRTFTQKNLGELQRQYDWLAGEIAKARRAANPAVAAGGGAGVIEFGGPAP